MPDSVRGRRLKFNSVRVSLLEVRERNFRIFQRRKNRKEEEEEKEDENDEGRGRNLAESSSKLVIWPTSEVNPDLL